MRQMHSGNGGNIATLAFGVLMMFADMGCGDTGSGPVGYRGTLSVRHLTDATGPTKDVSVPSTAGIVDFFAYQNRQGGIRGYHVNVETVDFGYQADRAESTYNLWKTDASFPDVVTIFGLGTPDSVRLSPFVTRDQIPYLSQSYLGSLAAPRPLDTTYRMPDGSTIPVKNVGAPYNFFVGTDYSTAIRIAMEFVKKRGGRRVAFLHCSANAYCTGPIPAGKSYLSELGIAVAPDPQPGEFPELADSEEIIATKLSAYLDRNPDIDWAWIGNLTASTVSIAKTVAAKSPNVRMIVNTWGFDETVFGKCGSACVDRLFGLVPFSAYGDTRYSEMENVVACHDVFRFEQGAPAGLHANLRYVQGYVTALIWAIAVERLVEGGQPITRENLRNMLETFRGIQTGGLAAPVTFTPEDHRPTSSSRIYSINSAGKLKYQDEIQIRLRPEWLGW